MATGGYLPAAGCREATFYVWKKTREQWASASCEAQVARDGNVRLKRLVADLSVDKHILTEALRKTA